MGDALVNLLLLNSFDKIVNSQDVSNIQNFYFISRPTSPSAADGKAGEARPWWESPAGECQCVSPQPPPCHRTLNLKHQQVGELVCVTSTSNMSQNVTSNLGSQEVSCHLKPQTLTS